MTALLMLTFIIFSLLVLYHQVQFVFWALGSFIIFILGLWSGSFIFSIFLFAIIISLTMIAYVPTLRQAISHYVYTQARNLIPKLSKTEEEALNAGDTWLEQD